MSFNGADSAPGGGSINPASNLGDSSPGNQHDITAGDVAVIVGAVAVLVLLVVGVLWYRLRRKRTTAADVEVVEMEEGAVGGGGGGGGGGDGLDKRGEEEETGWKVMAWREGKNSKEEEGGGTRDTAVGGKDGE